mmetsp:Transcript_7785/g.16252  ORF Transcript_7785/g.16252 Transcript_7785/m.16252 type:complete len:246 (-) Transcript_7785:362-1099(-)
MLLRLNARYRHAALDACYGSLAVDDGLDEELQRDGEVNRPINEEAGYAALDFEDGLRQHHKAGSGSGHGDAAEVDAQPDPPLASGEGDHGRRVPVDSSQELLPKELPLVEGLDRLKAINELPHKGADRGPGQSVPSLQVDAGIPVVELQAVVHKPHRDQHADHEGHDRDHDGYGREEPRRGDHGDAHLLDEGGVEVLRVVREPRREAAYRRRLEEEHLGAHDAVQHLPPELLSAPGPAKDGELRA